jgi:YqaJ-like viral recombinase domain
MIHNVEQYSEEWWKLRNGKVTASMVWAVLKRLKRKDGEAQDRKHYRDRIVAQILCGWQGQKDDEWKGPEAEWGREFEPIARATYEVRTNSEVSKIGFCTHDSIDRFGCSPDGAVGSKGLVQFKCPKTTTHLNYLIDGIVPEEYEPQMAAELACMPEREWSDFVSFDPRLPEDLQLFIVRLDRNHERIAEIEARVMLFLDEVDAAIARLTRKEISPELRGKLRTAVAV